MIKFLKITRLNNLNLQMKSNDSRIILENQQRDFLFKKRKSNLNISFNRISLLFFIFFIIFLIYSIHLVHLGSRNKMSSDILNINSRIILNAWKKLYTSNVVFGPAEDGGFWLIGISQSKKIKGLFNNVIWSQHNTLEQVKKNINSSKKISFVKTLKDID